MAGSTTLDLNVIEGRRFAKPGGVTTYAGITYRRHGLPTWVATRVAAQDRRLLAPLADEGVVVLADETPETTRFINRVEAGRRSQQMPSRASAVSLARIAEACRHADALHLGPLHPQDIEPGAFRGLSHPPGLLVLDVQGYVRALSGDRIRPEVSGILDEALGAARVVKSSRSELDVILEHYGRSLSRMMKDFDIREWVVTEADRGGFVQDGPAGTHPFEAERVETPVDPTGAGDVFLAAYVWARFRANRPVDAAARHAARLSAAQVAGRFIRLPDLETARETRAAGLSIDKGSFEV